MRISRLVLLSLFVGLPATADVCSMTHNVTTELNPQFGHYPDHGFANLIAISKSHSEQDALVLVSEVSDKRPSTASVNATYKYSVVFETEDAIVPLDEADVSMLFTPSTKQMRDTLNSVASAFLSIQMSGYSGEGNRTLDYVLTKRQDIFKNKDFALPNSPEQFMCVTGANIDKASGRAVFDSSPTDEYVLPGNMLNMLYEGQAKLAVY